eukprot:403345932
MTRFNIKGKGSKPSGSQQPAQGASRNSSPVPAVKSRVVVSAQAKRQAGGSLGGHAQQNQISSLREKSLKSDRWNLFVGDNRYKTNFMLQFKDRFTSILYEKSLLPNAIYSIRMFILTMAIFDLFVIGYDSCQLDGCLMSRSISTLLSLISIIGTLKQAKTLKTRMRHLMMMCMPLYWSLRIISFYDGKNEQFSTFLFYIPTFLMSLIIISEWLEYLVFSLIQTLMLPVLYKFCYEIIPEYSVMNLYMACFKSVVLYVIAFAIFEKIKKEQFVIGYTNSQTKKLLLGLFNAQPHPIVIVGSDGQIQFCNQPFEQMLNVRLNVKQVPNTIFKLTTDDEDSTQRLKQLVNEILKPQASGNNLTLNNLKNSESSFYGYGEKSQSINKKIEIKLGKNQVKSDEGKKKFKETQPREEGKNNATISDRQNQQKDIFEKFEIASITGEQVNYLSKKAIMLTFSIISEQKAKNRLIYLHSNMLFKFLNQFNKRLQQLNQKVANDEEIINNSSILEFLGATYVAINQVQQIQHEILTRSDAFSIQEENFLLKDEIMQCVESLSVKCLSPSCTLKLDPNRGLPEKLSGDLQRFRLALQAVSEFAMRYCTDGSIQIAINFDSVIDSKYLIAFEYIFCKNSLFNEEPLINLLNTLSKTNQAQLEEQLLKNYEDLFDLISQFGIGMLIFPTLITHLDGTFAITTIEPPPESKEEEKVAAFEGEQDQAHPVSSNKGGLIKIIFKIPFSHAEISKRVMSPYTPINKTKQQLGNCHVYKSPNLISKENREQALSRVRQIMEQNRSPLIGSNATFQRPNQHLNFNHFKGPAAICGSNLMSDNLNSNLNPPQCDIENSFGNNSTHLGSNNLNNSNNKNRKNSQLVTPNVDHSIVKRVENKLKNFEQKHPPNKNLFQNQNQFISQNQPQLLDEKEQMEMTNSRKNSQQVLPSNLIIQQKAQELAPLEAHRIQSMNYIVHGLQSNRGGQHQFNSNKSGEANNSHLLLGHQNSFGGVNQSHAHSQGNNSNNMSIGNSNNLSKEQKKKKPSLFIKIKALDEESHEQSSRKQEALLANKDDLKHINGQKQIEQNIISQISEQQQQFEEDQKIQDRDKELDSFLLDNQELPVVNNSRSSSKSFRVARTLKPSDKAAPTHSDQTLNKQDMSQDELRKVLSFGQGLSARGNRKQLHNQYQNIQNFFVQNNIDNHDSQNVYDNNNGGLLDDPIEENTPILRQDDMNLQELSNQQIRFGEQSPIEAISDGAENFESEDISEDDTSEILAQLSNNQDDQEEEKEVQAQVNSKNQMDNSFDKVCQNLSGAMNNNENKLQIVHRRKMSKTKRIALKSNKHEPLSKHIPKDILTAQNHGASKNLLSSSKDMSISVTMNNTQNGSPFHKGGLITPDNRGPRQASLVYDDPIKRNSSHNYEQPRYRDSYSHDETFCPFRRGKNTLEYQHNLRKADHARIGVPVDPIQQIVNNTPFIIQKDQIQNTFSQNPSINQLNSNNVFKDNKSSNSFINDQIRVWNEQTMIEFTEEWNKLLIASTNPRLIPGSGQQLPYGLGNRQATYRDDTLKYVLIAEDNIMISMCLQELLKQMDYTPIEAKDGKIAVEKFASFMKDEQVLTLLNTFLIICYSLVFDLILMDIYMPEMNGYESTRAIRQLEIEHNIPECDRHFICGFSAEKNDGKQNIQNFFHDFKLFFDIAVLKKCLEAGMNDLYDKTMTKDILTDLLKKCQRPPRVPKEESHSQGVDRMDLTLLPGMMSNIKKDLPISRLLI